MIIRCLLFGLSLLVLSCNNKNFIVKNYNDKFIEYKKNFPDELINQFPKTIIDNKVDIYSDTERKRNVVGLYLYEYEIDKKRVNKLRKQIEKNAIAKYTSSENCLLVVNRFETNDSYDKMVTPDFDSTKVDRTCEKSKIPIPNFIHYNSKNKYNDLRLDDTFSIYVLDAKSGNQFHEYNLLSNSQMPKKWENGYSKGVAMSEKKNTIIFFSIIW